MCVALNVFRCCGGGDFTEEICLRGFENINVFILMSSTSTQRSHSTVFVFKTCSRFAGLLIKHK